MLTNVTATETELIATGDNAVAISEPTVQQLTKNDFRSIAEYRGVENLNSLAISNTTTEIITLANLTDKTINVMDADNTIHELIVNSDMITSEVDVMLFTNIVNNDSYSKYAEVISSHPTYLYNYRALDAVQSTHMSYRSVTFGVKLNSVNKVNFVDLYVDCSAGYTLDVSEDGVEWTTIGTYSTNTVYTKVPITTDKEYSYYRVSAITHDLLVYTFNLYGTINTVDISSLSLTDDNIYCYIPNKHYINDLPLSVDYTNSFLNKDNGDFIFKLDDIVFYPSRTITNKIELSDGNRVTDMGYGYNDIDYEVGNAIHTSNVLPANTVTSVGLTTSDEAYKVFDGLDTPAFTEVVPADGVIDIQHIYEFDTPTICYRITMSTNTKESAPKDYTVSGSSDGTTYVELLSVQQDLGVGDIEITKSFDITKYDAYKFYKITLTKGTIDGTVSVNQYKLWKEKTV